MKKIITLMFSLSCVLSVAQNGLQFDGVDDYVQCPLPGPTGALSRTVEAWVKIPSTVTVQKVILDWGDMQIGGRFTLNIINGIPRIEVGGNGFNSTAAISTNSWHHIAATYDNNAASKLKLFVDGLQVAAGNPSVTTSTNSTNGIIIGRRNDATGHFLGSIDEVRVWNSARSQSQIAADMSSVFCTPFAGLVAYYNFNQGVAAGSNAGQTTLTNLVTATNNGVLTNFALTGSSSNWVSGTPLTSFNANTTQSGGSLIAVPTNGNYQWINCSLGGALIVGATQQNYTPLQNGSYAVIISKNGCVDTSACVNMTVSIDELNQPSDVHIYPNPFSSTINLTSLEEIETVRLFNLQGQLIYKNDKIHEHSVALSFEDLVSGFYYLEIEKKYSICREKICKK